MSRMMRRAAFRPDLFSLQILVWTLCSEISPKSMRLALSAAIRLRSRAAAAKLRVREFVEWDPRLARRAQEGQTEDAAGTLAERRSDAAAG